MLALVIGVPLCYWTYALDHDGFRWLSLLPGTVGVLLLFAALGMVFGDDDTPDKMDVPAGA